MIAKAKTLEVGSRSPSSPAPTGHSSCVDPLIGWFSLGKQTRSTAGDRTDVQGHENNPMARYCTQKMLAFSPDCGLSTEEDDMSDRSKSTAAPVRAGKISTAEFAEMRRVQPTTIRRAYSLSGNYLGVVPVKLANGHLLWDAAAVDRALSGGCPAEVE